MRLFSLLLLTFPCLIFAQTEGWMGISFEHEVSSNWGYVIDVEHRRALSDAPEGTYLLLLGANRYLAKNLDLTFGTRYELDPNEDTDTWRIFSDLNYNIPLGESRFTLESRLRYQQDRSPVEEGSGVDLRVAARPRIGLATDLGKGFTLITEYEGRFRFDDREEWSRVRYTAGLEYKISDRLQLETFWRRENRINQPEPENTTIFGLYVDYTLPDKRERDWKYRRPFGRRLTW